MDENEPIQPLQNADVDDYSDPNWEPEPIDAGPDFRANKPSDIISTLVSIYDSKDLFVKELQVLLAQRLLAISDDGMEKVEREVSSRVPALGPGSVLIGSIPISGIEEEERGNSED